MIEANLSMKTILQNFINHVEDMEAKLDNGEDLYDSEFQELKNITDSLKGMQYYAANEGVKVYNRRKNRYKDILPFDVTRVVLSQLPGIDGSDYINANYIRGASGSQAYIAAQGPLASTVEDFWRMVVECDVQVIVMACNETESGRMKCENYWPDETSGSSTLQCGEFGITLIQWRSICDDFSVRKLAVRYRDRKKNTQESRVVCQFHYTAWPDHGVPTSVAPLLRMMRMVRETQTSETLPVLVHCSAGCGRTGCICAIDFVWGLLRTGGLRATFSLFDLVAEMRRQRVAMVQTKDQYTLVHRAVCQLFMEQLRVIDNHPYANLPLSEGPDHPQQGADAGRRGDELSLPADGSKVAEKNAKLQQDDRISDENGGTQPCLSSPLGSGAALGNAPGRRAVHRHFSLRLAPPLPDKRRSLSAVPLQLVPPARADLAPPAETRTSCSRTHGLPTADAPRRLARSHSSVTVGHRPLVPVSTTTPVSAHSAAVSRSGSVRADRRQRVMGNDRCDLAGAVRGGDCPAVRHSMSALSVSRTDPTVGERACRAVVPPSAKKEDGREEETGRVVGAVGRSQQNRHGNNAAISSPGSDMTIGQSATLVGIVKPRPRLIAPPLPLPPPPPLPPSYPGGSRGSQPRQPVRRSRSLKLTAGPLAPSLGTCSVGPEYLALEEPGPAAAAVLAPVSGRFRGAVSGRPRRQVSASQPARLDAIGRYERRLVHCSRQLGLNDTLDEQQQQQQLSAGGHEQLLSPALVASASGQPLPSARKPRVQHSYDNCTPLALDSRQCMEQQLRRNPRAGVYDVTSSGDDRAVAALRCITRRMCGERRASFRRAVLGSSCAESSSITATTNTAPSSLHSTVSCSSTPSSSTSSLSSASLVSLPAECGVSDCLKTACLMSEPIAVTVAIDVRDSPVRVGSSETPSSAGNTALSGHQPLLTCDSATNDSAAGKPSVSPSGRVRISEGSSLHRSNSTASCSTANTCSARAETSVGSANSSTSALEACSSVPAPRCVGNSVFYGASVSDSATLFSAVSTSSIALATSIFSSQSARFSTSISSNPSGHPTSSISSSPSVHPAFISSNPSMHPASSISSTPSTHTASSISSTPALRPVDRLLVSHNSAFRPYRHSTAESSNPAVIPAPAAPATPLSRNPTEIKASGTPAANTAFGTPAAALNRNPAAIIASGALVAVVNHNSAAITASGTPAANTASGTPAAAFNRTPAANTASGTPAAAVNRNPAAITASGTPATAVNRNPAAITATSTPAKAVNRNPAAITAPGTPATAVNRNPAAITASGTPATAVNRNPTAITASGTPAAAVSRNPAANTASGTLTAAVNHNPAAITASGTPATAVNRNPAAITASGTAATAVNNNPAAITATSTPATAVNRNPATITAPGTAATAVNHNPAAITASGTPATFLPSSASLLTKTGVAASNNGRMFSEGVNGGVLLSRGRDERCSASNGDSSVGFGGLSGGGEPGSGVLLRGDGGERCSTANGDGGVGFGGSVSGGTREAAGRYKSEYAVVHRTFNSDMPEVPGEMIARGLRPTAPPRSKRASCGNMLQMADRRFSLSQPYLSHTGRPVSLMVDSFRRVESDTESIPPQVPEKTTASYQLPTPTDCYGAAVPGPVTSDISPNHRRGPTDHRPAVRSLLGRLHSRAAGFRARIAGWVEPSLSSPVGPGPVLVEKSNPASWQAYV